MKVKMTIEFEMDDKVWEFTEEEKLWIENEIFVGNETLILHSNEIRDSVGVIKKVSNIQYER